MLANDGPSDNAWGVDLVDAVLVSHQQRLVLFARERGARTSTLYFRVVDPSAASAGDAGQFAGSLRVHRPIQRRRTPSPKR